MKVDKQQFDAVLSKLLATPATANAGIKGSRTAHRPKAQTQPKEQSAEQPKSSASASPKGRK